MPDAHWGYGFPIGGVAAFDPDAGGVVSAGGVGFDISCGVRCLRAPHVALADHTRELRDVCAQALFERSAHVDPEPCGRPDRRITVDLGSSVCGARPAGRR
jgi:hypothetical protein